MTNPMMTTNLLTTPYLPRQKSFPNDNSQLLGVALDKAYVEISQRVNERTIGVFAVNYPVVTGETWYFAGQPSKQQTLRQAFPISPSGTAVHNIITTQISGFTRIYGTFTDGTNFYPLPYVGNVLATDNVLVKVTPTLVFVQRGSTAPSFVSGLVVLEWLSNY